MDSFVFEMRLLDSQQANISTTLFGAKLRAPIVAAAICESRILKRLTPWDPPYLEQIAAGLADAGSMMSTGMVTLEELGKIVDQGAPVLHVVKPFKDDEEVLRHLERAAEAGVRGGRHGRRRRLSRKGLGRGAGASPPRHKTLDDLRRFRAATKLPFVLKGVLSAHDARLAREIGADGLIVSSMGARPSTMRCPCCRRCRTSVPRRTAVDQDWQVRTSARHDVGSACSTGIA